MAEKLFKQALELDSEFEPSLSELLRRKCTKRIGQKPKELRDVWGNVCCWPNEQNIVCFGEKTKLSGRTRTRCFRLETAEEEPFRVEFVYFRCNTPYTVTIVRDTVEHTCSLKGRSYPPPPFARLIGPLLRPAGVKQDMVGLFHLNFSGIAEGKTTSFCATNGRRGSGQSRESRKGHTVASGESNQ